jgi:hypothetical protein
MPTLAQDSDTLFTTAKTELFFDISKGRANPITISTGSPGYPGQDLRPDHANLCFYWLIKMRPTSDKVAQEIRLWLFKVRDGSSPSMDPPSYGLGSGHYLLRYPSGNNTFPRKEDTQLWKDYINPNFELAAGAHMTVGTNYSEELAGTTWPNARAMVQYIHPSPDGDPGLWQAAGIPLRVAMPDLAGDQTLLLLFELRRYGRLYLIARPVRVRRIVKPGIVCPFKSTFGSSSDEVAVIQTWRDTHLSRTALGRTLIKVYYRFAAPTLSRLLQHHAWLHSPLRWLMRRAVHYAQRQLTVQAL